jgi:hypothetical protein
MNYFKDWIHEAHCFTLDTANPPPHVTKISPPRATC